MTGLAIDITEFVLKLTAFVLNVTGFVLNITELVLSTELCHVWLDFSKRLFTSRGYRLFLSENHVVENTGKFLKANY